MHLAILPVHLSNVLRLPRKSDPLQISHACHRFWKCYNTKKTTFCSLLTRCTIPCACHAKAHLNVQKCSVPVSFLHFWLQNVLRATTACTFSTSQLPKVVRSWCVFYILTSKCASCYNGVHFFDISTSKRGPELVCFVHFDIKMCFAPQRRALFQHLNFQKWSEHGVFCTFWLANVLRATTACNFSSLIWPDGSAPAALASLLFDPPEPQIIGKTQCFATFPPFRASASSFFWLFLFSDLLSSTLLFSLPLPISAFHLSILSEVWLLNFLRLYPCGGLPQSSTDYVYLLSHPPNIKHPTLWSQICVNPKKTWFQMGVEYWGPGGKGLI